jgi:hypothetical protein
MAKLAWTPWHKVVKLREDLRSGELPLHMFAADLYEVMMQRGKRPVYERPEEFFALTFPTYNLRRLVRDVALRLAGKNDKAVRQLELTYGGGKTHTLITLRHLVHDPERLPDLPAVAEFIQDIGPACAEDAAGRQRPPKCRVVGLCFDKLDVEKGMEVRSPNGKSRTLKQPWSVLAYQIAGEAGLKILHASGKAEERESAPAENLLTELLEVPGKEGLGVLILVDEVLMYAREKVSQDPEWRARLANFFQYLTQAVPKVDRCCLVASLLATDPRKSDKLGREIQAELYDIFQREREEAVEPVVKEDVAEVLRRRFFTPDSLKDREAFRQHVMAALKGIAVVDEQTAKQGAEAEARFVRSFPFHPDLTEVLYSKWTQLTRFQRTRGVLRTFALALREAEAWDTSPLVGPAVFLAAPEREGLSEALRELVAVADTEEWEGKKQAWTGILDNEFAQAKRIQVESVGLKYREVERAVVTTFLHSQPIGQTAQTRDLLGLLGATRPDRIELEKGLTRWAQTSYWLDDLYTGAQEGQLPGTWRLGNRPNLTQMHAVAAKNISGDTVRARLLDDITKTKALTANASAMGVHVHTLPTRPRDIEDDGAFHYAVLGLQAASESGKPSAEAARFLDETTGPDKPRVYRNAVLLLVPSRDGLELATARVRDYLAWEIVREDIKKQQKDGNVDPARALTLQINIDKAKGRIPDAIRQAYCIVVTVSEKDEVQAFKITVNGDPHFTIIKGDRRSRVQDTAIAAEALLPDGPYNLWRPGELSRRVKDLAGAFAQLPHLPKMLKASAILDTLADGCAQGTFVLRLVRPDGTSRTWWMSRPDENALNDSALELVLPQGAELRELGSALLVPERLPGLWPAAEITVQAVADYFNGSTVAQVERQGYKEPMPIPKAGYPVVEKAISAAVETGSLWMLSGPASILGEPIPPGVLNPSARLCAPPPVIAPAEILPENLPNAWKDGVASGLSIATALSVKAGKTLPWKTVRDAISMAIQVRFLEVVEGSQAWPCGFPSAQFARFRVVTRVDRVEIGSRGVADGGPRTILVATGELQPGQVQELGDIVPKLLQVKAMAGTPIRFHVRVEVGDGQTLPAEEVVQEINTLLQQVREDLRLR